MTQPGKPSGIHGLLIGVDYYFPNRLPDDGSSYPSLGGCVRDINYVEDFLVKHIGIPQENITKLTASKDRTDGSGSSSSSGQGPLEPKEKWPTYENMVSAFKQVTNNANSDDQVYIHYSGHGGRAKTIYPKLKEHTGGGLDEALVPTDIGDSEKRYLRDVELAYLLKSMVDKGLIVTIVLDSCHSGGATRGTFGTVARGTGRIDKNDRPADSLVAAYDELSRAWTEITGFGSNSSSSSSSATGRNVQTVNGWVPEPKGYVLLAACEPNQSAFETVFDGEKRGALTFYLLDSLKHKGPNFTYRMLHDQTAPKIRAKFAQQTPMLQGDRDRVVFAIDSLQPSLYAVNVTGFDSERNSVKLNTGKVHGIGKEARFEVYPPGTTDYSKADKRIAVVKVIEAGATEVWAEVVERFSQEQQVVVIEQGSQAVLVDAASTRLMRKVSIRFKEQPPLRVNQIQALERVKDAIEQLKGHSLIVLASQEENADYQVAIEMERKEEYEILDPAGNKIPNINPPLKISDADAPAKIVKRLIHLIKYSNIQQLDNYDTTSPLARKLVLELFALQQDYEPGDKPELNPLVARNGTIYTINEGQYFLLRIHNLSNQVLKVAAFDLQPGWAVEQIFPRGSDTDYLNIDPKRYEDVILRAYLPQGYQKGKDVIKAFATVNPTSCRWLELPSLDKPVERTRATGPQSELEQFMAIMTEDRPKTRDVQLSVSASHEWTTSQLEIEMKRNHSSI
jgi:Caspase domain